MTRTVKRQSNQEKYVVNVGMKPKQSQNKAIQALGDAEVELYYNRGNTSGQGPEAGRDDATTSEQWSTIGAATAT